MALPIAEHFDAGVGFGCIRGFSVVEREIEGFLLLKVGQAHDGLLSISRALVLHALRLSLREIICSNGMEHYSSAFARVLIMQLLS